MVMLFTSIAMFDFLFNNIGSTLVPVCLKFAFWDSFSVKHVIIFTNFIGLFMS